MGAFDGIAFLDLGIRAKQYGADVFFVEVHDHASHAIGENQKLAKHRLFQAIAKRDAVADGNHGADVIGF